MKKYMSDEEFIECDTVSNKDLYDITKDLESKNIINISDQIKYVEKNYDGQVYMYFMLKTLDDVILQNYHEVNDSFKFSESAIDGLLRAYLFSIQYMQDGLPEHSYDYSKSKISTFVYELLKQYKENKNLKDI